MYHSLRCASQALAQQGPNTGTGPRVGPQMPKWLFTFSWGPANRPHPLAAYGGPRWAPSSVLTLEVVDRKRSRARRSTTTVCSRPAGQGDRVGLPCVCTGTSCRVRWATASLKRSPPTAATTRVPPSPPRCLQPRHRGHPVLLGEVRAAMPPHSSNSRYHGAVVNLSSIKSVRKFRAPSARGNGMSRGRDNSIRET